MIKFFRNIRHRLLTENKVGKYLIYAIGEIILVVIGILLALQINDWNNERIEIEKEREYLSYLRKDIERHVINIDDQINHESQVKTRCEKALKILETLPVNSDSLSALLVMVSRRTFVINDPVFEDLKSSGNLTLIRNNDLRQEIMLFYQYLDFCELAIQTNNVTAIADFRSFIIENSIVDFAYSKTMLLREYDYSLDAEPFAHANSIINEKIRDKFHLLQIRNQIAHRGRLSGVHSDLMTKARLRNNELLNQLDAYSNSYSK